MNGTVVYEGKKYWITDNKIFEFIEANDNVSYWVTLDRDTLVYKALIEKYQTRKEAHERKS